jgi:Transglutaminase-like superfamily
MNVAWKQILATDATVDDTLEAIVNTVNDWSNNPFSVEAAKAFDPKGNKLDYMHRLFDWCCANVDYKLDPNGTEYINTPNLTFLNGTGDCKKITIFLASILKAAGITPVLKHVYYDGNTRYSHIYVIVPYPDLSNYITLDPTNECKFNKEVEYADATLYFLDGSKKELDMDLVMMGNSNTGNDMVGIIAHGCRGMDNSMGIIAMNVANPTHAEILKKLLPKHPATAEHLANIPIENQRGSFLEMVKMNVDGLATHLLTAMAKNPEGFSDFWGKIGGNVNEIKQAVLDGAKAPITSSATIAGFNLKSILHGAAGVLRAIAPVADVIIPGAGVAIDGIADKADQIANSAPIKLPNGQLAPPPTLPADTGIKIPPTGGMPHDDKIFGLNPLLAAGVAAGALYLITKS